MASADTDVAAAAEITYEWRGSFDNHELNALHAECFEHRMFDDDWWGQVNRHSLGGRLISSDPDTDCGEFDGSKEV